MTRRTFLAAFALAAIGGGAGVVFGTRDDDEVRGPAGSAARLLDDASPARRLGRAYLDDNADERTEAALVRLVPLDWSASAERFAEEARRLVRSDFERGRVTRVGGWTLSVTEARLCALTTFA